MTTGQTATEVAETLRDRAIINYQRDIRFRNMVQSVVHRVMQDRRINDEMTYRPRDIADILTDFGALVFELIYEEDAEISRLVQERDHFRKLAEEAVAIAPPRPLIFKADQ